MNLLGFGAYADVFGLPDGRALKAFRRRVHGNAVADWTDPATDWSDHDAISRAFFRAEARGYELLQSNNDVSVYLPQYFGRFDPRHVLGSGIERAKYLPGCGLIIEQIPGKAVKLDRLNEAIEAQANDILERIQEILKPAVLVNVWDASCFVPGTRAPFTIIDFALWDEHNYEEALGEGRCLTPEERVKLELANRSSSY